MGKIMITSSNKLNGILRTTDKIIVISTFVETQDTSLYIKERGTQPKN